MLQFGSDITFMALLIIGMISDLHLHAKLMGPPVEGPSTKNKCIFALITKSNIEMYNWILGRTLVSRH